MNANKGVSTTWGVRGVVSWFLPALALLASQPARADFVVGPSSSSGGIDFSVKPAAGGVAGAPVFGPSGQLISPGNGYPTLGAPIPAVQSFGGGIAAPAVPIAAGLSATANPAVIAAGQDFGSGQTSLVATSFPDSAWVLWTNFSVSDTPANGKASVNESRGLATYTSVVNSSVLAGVFLGVQGHLSGEPNAFVAAAIRGTISIDNRVIGPLSVVIASDGSGPLGDFVGATSFSGFFSPGANDFLAYGVSLLPDRVAVGSTIRIDATLTLMADPSSSISFAAIPPGVLLPNIGAGSSAVPEPSGLVLVGIGGVTLLARFARRGGPRAVGLTTPDEGRC